MWNTHNTRVQIHHHTGFELDWLRSSCINGILQIHYLCTWRHRSGAISHWCIIHWSKCHIFLGWEYIVDTIQCSLFHSLKQVLVKLHSSCTSKLKWSFVLTLLTTKDDRFNPRRIFFFGGSSSEDELIDEALGAMRVTKIFFSLS